MIKRGIKIRVTPEQSKQIQQICFDNGINWWVSKDSKIRSLDKPYLFIDKEGITYCEIDEEDYFKQEDNTEVTAELFIKTNGTCEVAEYTIGSKIKNKFMKLIDKRNKANKKLRKFAKKYGLEDLI